MWLFTKSGYLSAVEHNKKPRCIIVRARVLEDIVDFAKFTGQAPKETRDADYRYRIEAKRKDWVNYVAKQAREIDYPNFKDKVLATQGADRAQIYMSIWALLYQLQLDEL